MAPSRSRASSSIRATLTACLAIAFLGSAHSRADYEQGVNAAFEGDYALLFYTSAAAHQPLCLEHHARPYQRVLAHFVPFPKLLDDFILR